MSGVLPAQTIRRLDIIKPFAERTVFNGVTFGLGPAGYDLRVAGDVYLWPGHCVLVDAIERFEMPIDVQGRLYTKSTWARQHVRVAGTIIDPGWNGVLRLEISQHDGDPVTILAGTGAALVIFDRLEEPTEQPYSGKYQNQTPGTNAIFEPDR
jgi:dCTP deaminase